MALLSENVLFLIEEAKRLKQENAELRKQVAGRDAEIAKLQEDIRTLRASVENIVSGLGLIEL